MQIFGQIAGGNAANNVNGFQKMIYSHIEKDLYRNETHH